MSAVRQFVDAFNRGDVDGMQAACAEATSIVDDFSPHEWSGRHATTTWYGEMARMALGHGMTAWSLTLAEPRRVIVSDGRAYVSVPADVRWLKHGEPAARACLLAMSLKQGRDGWRISSLAWAWN